jgi:hypothetical protein
LDVFHSGSYDERAVAGAAARRSQGQAEIWSAGSKHHLAALETGSRRQTVARGHFPPNTNGVSGQPRHHHDRPCPARGSEPQPAAPGRCGHFHVPATSSRSPATVAESWRQ